VITSRATSGTEGALGALEPLAALVPRDALDRGDAIASVGASAIEEAA
jgi:hypothetical protein